MHYVGRYVEEAKCDYCGCKFSVDYMYDNDGHAEHYSKTYFSGKDVCRTCQAKDEVMKELQ